MITTANIRNLVGFGITMYQGGMFVAECASTMSTILSMLSIGGYGIYAVGNYTYKGGKLIYQIYKRYNSKTHAI